MPKRRPTINDVAKRAGVSKATVSRVLNGTARVYPETLQAVQQAIKDVGYTSSWTARALATGTSETIGLVVTEDFATFAEDPTFTTLLEGIFDGFGPTPFTPIIVHASRPDDQRKVLQLIESRLFDAVIHLSPYSDEVLLDALHETQTPTVLCSRLAGDPWQGIFSTVFSDDVAGARMGARHMWGKGVRSPIVVTGPVDNPAATERVEGIREIYSDLPETRIHHTGWNESAGQVGIMQFLDERVAFDGIFCGSDRIAAGVLKTLERVGIRVPEDVKVLGFDDHPLASTITPPLSTVSQPMQKEGAQAAQLALDMLDGKPPRTIELPMTLRQRSTT